MAEADRPQYPFQAPPEEVLQRLDDFVVSTVSSLSSFYLELPRGDSFLQYEQFRKAYDELRILTANFKTLDRHVIHEAVKKNALVLAVLRCIVGLSPPELADMAQELTGVVVGQNVARNEDNKARCGEIDLTRATPARLTRIFALVDAACEAIEKGPKPTGPLLIHRLYKADTAQGLASVQTVATGGMEYSSVLYERMLGRPFATHRDSVSGLVGNIVEEAVMEELETAKVPYYKTKRIDIVEGFDQAPDFLIPDKTDPKIVIEAKLTQDDGTARDKITRVQHLDRLSNNGEKFEVIACIDGRGFKERPENMRKLLRATRGKVFSVNTMGYLVEQTSLKNYARPA